MRLAWTLATMAALSACANWPDLGIEGADPATGAFPALMPSDELVTTAGQTPEEKAAYDREIATLEARAAALRRRAAILGVSVEDQAELDAIRARLAALGR